METWQSVETWRSVIWGSKATYSVPLGKLLNLSGLSLLLAKFCKQLWGFSGSVYVIHSIWQLECSLHGPLLSLYPLFPLSVIVLLGMPTWPGHFCATISVFHSYPSIFQVCQSCFSWLCTSWVDLPQGASITMPPLIWAIIQASDPAPDLMFHVPFQSIGTIGRNSEVGEARRETGTFLSGCSTLGAPPDPSQGSCSLKSGSLSANPFTLSLR